MVEHSRQRGRSSPEPEPARWRARLVGLSLSLVPRERHRLFALTVLLGAACGVAAVSFHLAIRGAEQLLIDRALSATGADFWFWMLVTPTCGGLLSGYLLQYWVPNARGSGLPQVKYVYAVKSGRIRLRDASGKFALATLQIGTGAALGREGPTVHICAGIASALGRLFALSPQNARRLIPVGAAAGIAAAFNAPIAAVTFVIEEILGDLDQTVLSGVVIAAAVAAVIERSVLGEHPVLSIPAGYGLEYASSLAIYALLGVAASLASCVFYAALLSVRRFVRARQARLAWAWPAVGGLFTGGTAALIAAWFGVHGVTGGGYTTLAAALNGNLSVQILLLLAAAKLLCSVACYSTGGCGGIFAPVLFIGAMIGGSFGYLDQWVLGHADADLGSFALVGMGAFFAAVIRAPITSVLIIFEMTGGYGLVLPLMIANTVAYGLSRQFYAEPIYEQLLRQDGLYLPDRQRVATALSALHVRDAMTTDLVQLPAELSVREASARIEHLSFSVYPVLDRAGALAGELSAARLTRRLAAGLGEALLREVAQARECLSADQPLVDAVARMQRLGARQMIVVSELDADRVVGILAISDVMRAYASASLQQFDAPHSTASSQPSLR